NAVTIGSPHSVEVPSFHGKRWEDIGSWLSTIKAERTAGDALQCALQLLKGEAKISLLIVQKRRGKFENWKAFVEWAREEFGKDNNAKKTNFFGFLSSEKKEKIPLAEFIATALDFGIEADIDENSIVRAIVASMPATIRRMPETEKASTFEDLNQIIKDLSAQTKLAWQKHEHARPLNLEKKKKCNYCSKTGHLAHECRKKMKERKDSKVNALLCRARESHPLRVEGEINGLPASMLVDTGAKGLYVSGRTAKRADIDGSTPHAVTVADGRTTEALESDKKVLLSFKDTKQKTTAIIMPDLTESVILGREPLAKAKLVIDTESGEIKKKNSLAPRNRRKRKKSFKGGADIGALDTQEVTPETALPSTLGDARKELKAVLSKNEFDVGRTNVMECHIDTGTNQPVSRVPYSMTRDKEDRLKGIIEELSQRKLIERVRFSRWSSPAILVHQNEKYRLCVDYRSLNAITVTESHPMPTLQQIFTSLEGARYFSTLDLTKGFWQLPVSSEDAEKTTFTTKFGTFRWNVMPFGLKNAPALFQRMIDGVIDSVRGTCALAYIDDIIVYSKTREEHVEHLKTVARLLKDANLKISPTKCRFFCKEVTYLGHNISAGKITPSGGNIEKIIRVEVPRSTKATRSFLGMVNYYRDYIPNIARIAGPLYELTEKGKKFKWEPAHDQAFRELKEALEANCTLRIPDFQKPFVVYTDASKEGLGGILAQTDDTGQEKIVKTVSRTLSPAEKNYGITELECLSVVWTLEKFRYYLVGRQFKVVTDHRALEWLDSHKDSNSKLMRWALQLQDFGDFTIQFRAGKDHGNADGISRLPEKILALDSNETQTVLDVHSKLGHAAAEVTHKYLTRDPTWKGKLCDTERLIQDCLLCQNFGNRYDNFTKRRSTAFKPMEKIAIDIMDVGSVTDEGNKYVVAAIDYFSRWLFAKAIPDKTSETVAQFIENEIIRRFGIPDVLVSDNGKEFANVKIKALTSKHGIRHSMTSAYYPQANGLVERTNRTILKKLGCAIRDLEMDWDKALPQTTLAYNSCPIRSMGYSPFELLHGWTPRITKSVKRMEKLNTHELRKEVTEKHLLEEEKQANKGKATDDLEPNTKILLDSQRINPTKKKKKLLKRWIGPYIVDSNNANGQYVIRDRSGRTIRVNRRHLRPYKGQSPVASFEEGGDVDSTP
ncbi:MAG: uncharacterized protein A8A55_2499, partial [Amphiamblys sp. WSBS2006]